MDNIVVLDDFLPKYISDSIELLFLDTEEISWGFLRDATIGTNSEKVPGYKKIPGFGHCILNHQHTNSKVLEEVTPILRRACDKLTIKINEVFQVRSFLTLPLASELRKTYDHIHIDTTARPHMVCLYYVNNSDGDTYIFDKIYESGDGIFNDTIDPPILKQVTPKKGRAVIFNGFRYHSGSLPTGDVRCVLNFNFV
jgi:hypothetical protein